RCGRLTKTRWSHQKLVTPGRCLYKRRCVVQWIPRSRRILGRDVGGKIGRSRSVWRPLHRGPTLRIPRRHPWVNRAKSLGSSTISVCCVFLLLPWLWPAPIAHGATARCAVFAETVTTGSSGLLTRQHLLHPGIVSVLRWHQRSTISHTRAPIAILTMATPIENNATV